MAYARAIVLALSLLLPIEAVAADSGLRIATWNIYWLGDTGNNRREEGDYVSLRTIADDLAADVVALQEVGDKSTVAKVFSPRVTISSYPRGVAHLNARGSLFGKGSPIPAFQTFRR